MSIMSDMRRKPNKLIPLEEEIILAAMDLRIGGEEEFYGFGIAKELRDRKGARLLTAHGTLYRALGRLVKIGLLDGWWEDPLVAAEQNRPRRKFYRLTSSGVVVATEVSAAAKPANPAYGVVPG